MEFPEFLKHLMKNAFVVGGVEHIHEDPSGWNQVATFKPEDRLKHKSFTRAMDNAKNEVDTLDSRINVVKSRAMNRRQTWWNYLYKKYSLSPGRSYSITDDGRILMRPDK